MQLVIPMSGLGSRFLDAGYTSPKPLIKVNGRPIIEWVLHAFPEENVTFICREEHLKTSTMQATLQQLAPAGKIVSIPGHKKGPVYAVACAFDAIDDKEPVMVSYCDYYMLWDYQKFKTEAIARDCDGAIPCYSGFHPNLIPKQNLYASCKTDNQNNLIEIKEKFSFETDKTKALHSPGAYYFKSGAILKKYFRQMLDEGISLNGEYYCSLIYNLMVRDGLKVWAEDNVPYFCQWGTPQDLQDYEFWVNSIQGRKQ